MRIKAILTIGCLCLTVPNNSFPNSNSSLPKAAAGATISLEGLSLKDIPVLPVSVRAIPGPTLLLSDQPEQFPKDGIALKEDVQPGVIRLYLFHLTSGDGKRVTAIVENLSENPMRLRWRRYAFPVPRADYPPLESFQSTAKDGLMQYFSAQTPGAERIVASRERVVLDPALDVTPISPEELTHVFHEFSVDQPARVYVLQRDASVASLGALDHLAPLPGADHAGRGQFSVADFEAASDYDTAAGLKRIVLADGKSDPWLHGYDAIGGKDSFDKGNYGAVYRIRIRYSSSDGHALALVAVDQFPGVKYCDFLANAMVVNGQRIAIPSDKGRIGPLPEAVLIQTFPPAPRGSNREIEMEYSPPGASCTPTPLILMPYGS